ncbi:Glycerophosphodiester phosphodiesterase domain-containing protein 4 [Frankliniella fusca]|uniref:Glycerophosphodiester phosphodiesterase domain-containing protein 4 n=1 Tax=Frankliniella fusca TaxID=407009 RepID=A0AAE1GXW5_9NEOP|nr:Glycerophosphodiester phosphodiesterase domain-containing protein 4 [Frankliniella fusca]
MAPKYAAYRDISEETGEIRVCPVSEIYEFLNRKEATIRVISPQTNSSYSKKKEYGRVRTDVDGSQWLYKLWILGLDETEDALHQRIASGKLKSPSLACRSDGTPVREKLNKFLREEEKQQAKKKKNKNLNLDSAVTSANFQQETDSAEGPDKRDSDTITDKDREKPVVKSRFPSKEDKTGFQSNVDDIPQSPLAPERISAEGTVECGSLMISAEEKEQQKSIDEFPVSLKENNGLLTGRKRLANVTAPSNERKDSERISAEGTVECGSLMISAEEKEKQKSIDQFPVSLKEFDGSPQVSKEGCPSTSGIHPQTFNWDRLSSPSNLQNNGLLTGRKRLNDSFGISPNSTPESKRKRLAQGDENSTYKSNWKQRSLFYDPTPVCECDCKEALKELKDFINKKFEDMTSNSKPSCWQVPVCIAEDDDDDENIPNGFVSLGQGCLVQETKLEAILQITKAEEKKYIEPRTFSQDEVDALLKAINQTNRQIEYNQILKDKAEVFKSVNDQEEINKLLDQCRQMAHARCLDISEKELKDTLKRCLYIKRDPSRQRNKQENESQDDN